MEKTLPIHAWLGTDKPREKLMQQGRKSLSSIELLAILIGHGHQNNSAVDIAMSIMKKAQNHLPNIYRWEVDDFCKIKGMGKAKPEWQPTSFDQLCYPDLSIPVAQICLGIVLTNTLK